MKAHPWHLLFFLDLIFNLPEGCFFPSPFIRAPETSPSPLVGWSYTEGCGYVMNEQPSWIITFSHQVVPVLV
jgi:hypothetical protein